MAEIVCLVHRQDCAELFLYLQGLFPFAQSQTPTDTDTVGIRYNRRFVINVAHHEVGGFAAHAGEFGQFFHRVRHDAVVIAAQFVAHRINIARLGLIQSAGADDLFNVLHRPVAKGI